MKSPLPERVATMEAELKNVQRALDKKVSQEEFRPVMLIAYGIATAILGGALASLSAMLFKGVSP